MDDDGLSLIIVDIQYYTAGPLDANLSEEGAEGGEAVDDGNLYFEDAIYRPSFIGEIYNGSWEDFNPSQVCMSTGG